METRAVKGAKCNTSQPLVVSGCGRGSAPLRPLWRQSGFGRRSLEISQMTVLVTGEIAELLGQGDATPFRVTTSPEPIVRSKPPYPFKVSGPLPGEAIDEHYE